MFEELINKLENLDGQYLSIEMPIDDNGYFDRLCPNPDCGVSFKVLFEDWKNIVRDEVVYCPLCRHQQPADEWHTPEQEEYIKSVGTGFIQGQINEAIRKDATKFNRAQKPGLISMSLSYEPGPQILALPPAVAKELEQHYYCNTCKCHYSYLGASYFCPSCGTENRVANINEWIRNIENFILKHDKISASLETALNEEDTNKYIQQITEEHYCKIVTIFQNLAEYEFLKRPGAGNMKLRKNLFQNLVESSSKWKELTGRSYEDVFDANKYLRFQYHFQVRHLLSHTSGIVDDSFKKKTASPLDVGKRVLIGISDLEEFLSILIDFRPLLSNLS